MKAIIGWLTCKPGTRDRFLAAMAPSAAATRREEGCEFFEYHPHADDPDAVILIEGFRDAAAHEFHRRTPHMFEMQALIRDMLVRLRLVEVVGDDASRYDLDWIANPPGPYRP
jgi:quinol monooxygenase YgiN